MISIRAIAPVAESVGAELVLGDEFRARGEVALVLKTVDGSRGRFVRMMVATIDESGVPADGPASFGLMLDVDELVAAVAAVAGKRSEPVLASISPAVAARAAVLDELADEVRGTLLRAGMLMAARAGEMAGADPRNAVELLIAASGALASARKESR